MFNILNSKCPVFWTQPVRFSELNLSDFQNSSSQIFWAKPVRFSELNILKIFWTQHVPYSELYEYISHFLTSICQIFRTQPFEYFELNLSNILNSTFQILWAKPVRFSEHNILKIFWTQRVPYIIFWTQPARFSELNLSNILNSTRQIFWALSLSHHWGRNHTKGPFIFLLGIHTVHKRERKDWGPEV